LPDRLYINHSSPEDRELYNSVCSDHVSLIHTTRWLHSAFEIPIFNQILNRQQGFYFEHIYRVVLPVAILSCSRTMEKRKCNSLPALLKWLQNNRPQTDTQSFSEALSNLQSNARLKSMTKLRNQKIAHSSRSRDDNLSTSKTSLNWGFIIDCSREIGRLQVQMLKCAIQSNAMPSGYGSFDFAAQKAVMAFFGYIWKYPETTWETVTGSSPVSLFS
jgi:hypothetical protein